VILPGIRFSALTWAKVFHRPSLTLTGACAVLVVYIGLLMMSNYKHQVALRESTLKRFRLDVEKRAASVGYFFSERKYDLLAIADSREILSYFKNKSQGMSEQYGLKVNLFVIAQMLDKTLADKQIEGESIYERFLLTDQNGRSLADTASRNETNLLPPSFWERFPMHQADTPLIVADAREGKFEILMRWHCKYRNEPAGILTVWLNYKTLSKHFIDFSEQSAMKGFNLATTDGRLICIHGRERCPINNKLLSEHNASLSKDEFSLISFTTPEGKRNVFLTRISIRNTPLNLLAWIEKEELFGDLSPWQLLIGTGALALVILVGTGFLIRFNTNHLILKARFEDSEQQQKLLDRQVQERSYELLITNEELKKEIEQRSKAEADLGQAYNELKGTQAQLVQTAKLASIGELAAGVAHELNQPLMAIRTLAQVLLRSFQKLPSGGLEEHLKTIERNTGRMMSIINHLRIFSRQSPVSYADVNVNDVINDALLMVSEQLRLRNIEVHKTLGQERLCCTGNPNQLEQVFINLITNARDAITSKAETETDYHGRLEIIARFSADRKHGIEIIFRDNGSGISPENINRLFDPFFTTKEVGKGTGLGLSISYGIIKDHGGSIAVTGTSSEGTTFTIYLPEKKDLTPRPPSLRGQGE